MSKENSRSPGRPRSEQLDEAILEATLELMGEHGYARMSIDAVAARAGTSKPTIYLRYDTKAALAAAALAYLRGLDPPERSGETRVDLIRQLEHFRQGIERPHGMAMLGTVLAEESDTPELLAAFREHVVKPRRALVRSVLEEAERRGELRDDVKLDVVVNGLIGSYYAEYVARGKPARSWATRTTDLALRGIT